MQIVTVSGLTANDKQLRLSIKEAVRANFFSEGNDVGLDDTIVTFVADDITGPNEPVVIKYEAERFQYLDGDVLERMSLKLHDTVSRFVRDRFCVVCYSPVCAVVKAKRE